MIRMQRSVGLSWKLLVSSVIWGGLFPVSDYLLEFVPAMALEWLVYASALVVAVWTIRPSTLRGHPIRVNTVGQLVAAGMIGYGLAIYAQFRGTYLSSAPMGATIMATSPMFMMGFARVFLQESITRAQKAAAATALVGVFFIVGLGAYSTHVIQGIAWLLAGAAGWAYASVVLKQIHGQYLASTWTLTVGAIAAAMGVITPLAWHALWWGVRWAPIWHWGPLFALFYLGPVATLGAYYLWNHGLTEVRAGDGGLYLVLQPLVGTVVGALWFRQVLSWGFLLGASLIVLSLGLVARTARNI